MDFDSEALASQGISLYIHIPFCAKKCDYCDFYSIVSYSDDCYMAYSKAVVRELNQGIQALCQIAPRLSIRSVYVGGGTPNILPEECLGVLLSGISSWVRLYDVKEWTIEVNPEFLTAGQLGQFEFFGVTRISMGIQSLKRDGLDYLGRRCDPSQATVALQLLAKRWTRRWSIDFIAGLPCNLGQELFGEIKTALAYGATHLSLYELTIEPHSPLQERVNEESIEILGESERESQWEFALDGLTSMGFKRYEISNFSLPGHECQHNLRYWRLLPYLGCGPAAVSNLPLPNGRLWRRSHTSSVNSYLSAGYQALGLSGGDIEIVETRDVIKDILLMGLRTAEGIDLAEFYKRTGCKLLGIIEGGTYASRLSDLFWQHDGRLGCTAYAMDILNPILVAIFRSLER